MTDSCNSQTTITDSDRYRWLLLNAVEVSRDADGDEVTYFLHFDDVEIGETVEESIDRHIRTGSTEHLS